MPEKTGAGLIVRLTAAAERAGVDLITQAPVDGLYADDDGRILGVRIARADGSFEHIACRALILACNGYGGNHAMVQQYIPEIAGAEYAGHAGNQGDAVRWGGFEAINAPHNSISAVFAEEGGIGLFLYIAAQVFFIRAMYRHRHVYKLGWQTFLYCLLVYAVFGLDVGIAYYSDLNLFYMFVLGIILQIQLSMSRSEIADGTYGR